jgi:hypothetical protein
LLIVWASKNNAEEYAQRLGAHAQGSFHDRKVNGE